MARERTARDEESEERGRRRAERKSPAGTFGLVIVLGVLAVALGLFLMTKEKPAEAAPEKAAPVNPFADLPPETPPEKQERPKGQR